MSENCPICGNEPNAQDTSCSSCGYHFLGSTREFKPVAVDTEEVAQVAEQGIQAAQLRVIRGPQVEVIFPLAGETLVIGRSSSCDIFLNDMTVSRQHAKVESTKTGHRISDLNSYNGIWVENRSTDSCELEEGDIIQIGSFCLVYQRKDMK